MLLTETVDSDAQYRASILAAERTNFILINLVGRGLKAENQTLAGERLVSAGNKLD